MSRTAEEIVFEVDYWQAVLEDVKALNDLLLAAAQPIPEIPVVMLELIVGGDVQDAVDRVGVATRAAMRSLQEMNGPIDRLLELAKGRHQVLQEEADAC